MSQKRWILFFTILIVVMAGLYLFLTNRNTENRYVVISSEGKDVLHIDLETASEDPIVVFDSHYGQNILRVVDGEIFVEDADCPDKICVSHGPLTADGTPIICLPHHLVVRWADGNGEVDN